MQAVRIGLESEQWLSLLEDITTRAYRQERDHAVLLVLDLRKHTLTMRDEDGDSVYKVTMPIQVGHQVEDEESGVITCLVPPHKLEGMLPILRSGQGGVGLICRSTTLSFQMGNKSFVIPNRIVKATGDEASVSFARNGFDGERVVRFVIGDVEELRSALQACPDAIVRVRVGNGVVHVHTAAFATEARQVGHYLWPREALVARLSQLPAGVVLQVTATENRAAYLATVGGGPVVREIVLKQIPATTLYVSRPNVNTRQRGEDAYLWTNQTLLPERDRKREKRTLGVKEEPRNGLSLDELLGEIHEEAQREWEMPVELTERGQLDVEEEADLAGETTPESALQKLERLPGLAQVKKQIRDIAQYVCFEKERMQVLGASGSPLTMHMSFLGNPGTGKTMVARMIGEIFQELGLISKGHVVEVDRQMLVGAYMGHTEANLAKYVKRAMGGILFIDEAYSLYKKDSSKDFGLTAINGLVKVMEDHRDNLIVIVAGYQKEMNEFFSYNPGLRERIPFHVEFPEYSNQELVQVAEFLAAQDHYVLTDEAKEALLQRVMREKVDETFGNARTVRNLLDKAKIHHAVLAAENVHEEAAYTTLSAADFAIGEAAGQETLEVALAELDALVGLEDVKRLVRQMVNVLELEKKRFECGLENEPLTLHMAFTGNPGTGKTTVARVMGRVLRAMNLLPRGHYVEASRKDLIAGYMGQTTLKTAEKIKEALGGVLFIDEAYSLVRKGRADFGSEALATLIKEMEDKKGLVTVILAGYTKQMEGLFEGNPGLRSRVRFHLHFPDYTASELVEIVKRKAENAQYCLTEEAEEKLWTYFLKACLEAGEDFGNGRLAERVFDAAKIKLSERLASLQGEVSREQLMTITDEDLEFER